MAAAIIDLYPVHLQRYREAVVLAVCLVMFILGLSCVTQVRRTQNTSVSQGISLRSPFFPDTAEALDTSVKISIAMTLLFRDPFVVSDWLSFLLNQSGTFRNLL